MNYLFSGIGFGLTLSIMIGPIFFALIHAAIDRGFRAGTLVGAGVWVSDLSFILLVYYGISYIRAITSLSGFTFYTGMAGSVILLFFGIGTIINAKKSISIDDDQELPVTWFSFWLRGFLINTINPFTVFFWLSVISSVVVKEQPQQHEIWWFLTGIFCTIVSTDLLKIILAKTLRRWMKPKFIRSMRYASGVALLLFGLTLFFQSF